MVSVQIEDVFKLQDLLSCFFFSFLRRISLNNTYTERRLDSASKGVSTEGYSTFIFVVQFELRFGKLKVPFCARDE